LRNREEELEILGSVGVRVLSEGVVVNRVGKWKGL